MDIKSQHTVLAIQLQKKQEILHGIQRLKLLAAGIVLLTIFIAFFRPASSTLIFISLLAFWTVQFFATGEYVHLAKVARTIRLIMGGSYFPAKDAYVSRFVAAGVAVKDAFFLLLIFFDVSWLAHAYLYPAPAGSYHQFLDQLDFGFISGRFFIWFTVLLWIVYAYLFIVGLGHSDDFSFPEDVNFREPGNKELKKVSCEVWIKVPTFSNEELYLQGKHIQNPQKQPLILFPGLFQNGYVFDLSETVSLAHFLWSHNFDIWIVHPRGTAQSEGRKTKSSLDDFASDDIPAIIHHVLSRTGMKPVYVGHSQGGITAIISMMGALKKSASKVVLSSEEQARRQGNLKGLVTIGSYLDFKFSKPSGLKQFVLKGLSVKIGRSEIKLLRSQSVLSFLKIFGFLPTPVSFEMRRAILQSPALAIALFPLTLILNLIAHLHVWEFLYHLPNVPKHSRRILFYKTMDGTFSPIIQQFYSAIAADQMTSLNNQINYSAHYDRLTLPVSIVAMGLDSLADPVMMKQTMFDNIASGKKFFTVWEGMGHEDHFANTQYFQQVLSAIQLVC